jgi:tetratricopeptide (TPR) repeat protein
MKKVIRFMAFLYVFFFTISVMGAPQEYPKKESDFATLPPYCKAKLFYGGKSPQYKQWEQRMGFDTFVHVHHYCAALFCMQNAYSAHEERDYLLQLALGNIAYMQKHVPSKSRLMPEMLMKKGKILLMQGRDAEAVMAFHSSIALNKRYSPSYMAIADYYISREQFDDALDITEKGLIATPKSKGLKRRKDKIAGKVAGQGGDVSSDSEGSVRKDK